MECDIRVCSYGRSNEGSILLGTNVGLVFVVIHDYSEGSLGVSMELGVVNLGLSIKIHSFKYLDGEHHRVNLPLIWGGAGCCIAKAWEDPGELEVIQQGGTLPGKLLTGFY